MDNNLTFQVRNAAASALNRLNRSSFSGKGFSKEERDAIAEAVAAGIETYDRLKQQENNMS